MTPTLRSPAFTLREARRDDVPAIAPLAEQFAQHMRKLGDTSPLRLDAAALERDGFGPDPAFRGLVAEQGGQVVGYLLHHPGYDTDAARRLLFVVDLFVTPAPRGQGIATALMDAARDIAALGCRAVGVDGGPTQCEGATVLRAARRARHRRTGVDVPGQLRALAGRPAHHRPTLGS